MCFPLRRLFLQHWPPFRRCLEGHRWRLLLGQGGLPRLALFLTFSLPFYQDGQARPRFRSYRKLLFSCWFWDQERLYKRRSPPMWLRTNSSKENFQNRLEEFQKYLRERGYPQNLIKLSLNRNTLWKQQRSTPTKTFKRKTHFALCHATSTIIS